MEGSSGGMGSSVEDEVEVEVEGRTLEDNDSSALQLLKRSPSDPR